MDELSKCKQKFTFPRMEKGRAHAAKAKREKGWTHFFRGIQLHYQHRAHDSLDRRGGKRKEPRAQSLSTGLAHGSDHAIADVISESIEGEQAQQTHRHVLEPRAV